jgi:hypothetical protein
MKISLTEDEVTNIVIGHISKHYGVATSYTGGYMNNTLEFETFTVDKGDKNEESTFNITNYTDNN